MSLTPSAGGRRLSDWLPSIISFLLLLVSLWVLRHMLHDFRLRDVLHSLASLPHQRVIFAFLLVCCSYGINTIYDALGCRWIGKPIPYAHLAPASFIGYAFGNTLGMPLLSGGSVRYRLYSSWGLSAVEVTAVVAFCMWTYVLGCLCMLGLTLLLSPSDFLPLPINPLLTHALGFVLLAFLGGYFLLNLYGPKKIKVFKRSVPLPGAGITVFQIAIASLTIVMEATAVWCLIPPELHITLPSVVSAFVLSTTLGHISQVPGGIGVMETTMLAMLGDASTRGALLGVLILFRCFYNLLPLVLAVSLLGIYELFHERGWFRVAVRKFPLVSDQIVPQLIALTASAGGALLVLGGSLPPARGVVDFFAALPLPVVEVAHVVASLAGLRLLLLAPKLETGTRHAFHDVAWTLFVGIIAVFLRSFAIAQTIVLSVLLACIIVSEPVVRRRAHAIRRLSANPEWLLTIVTTVCGSIFLASLAFPHVFNDPDLWTKFALNFPAGRVLRTTGVVVLFALYWVGRGLWAQRKR